MSSSEAVGWATRVQVEEEVFGIGNGEMATVFSTVRVRVSDEGCLPVVVEEVVSQTDIVRTVGDVEQAIIVILGATS